MPRVQLSRAALIVAFLSVCTLSFDAAAATLSISAAPSTTIAVGQQYSFKPTVTNGNASEFEFNYINKPTWSKTYRGSGLIRGTPTAPGVYANIQIGVWDGAHYAVSSPFTITVAGSASTASATPTAALTINGNPPTSAEVAAYYSFAPTVVATAGSKLTYTIRNKPTWLTFSTATGALTGTPAAASVGTDAAIGISVSNGATTVALPAFSIIVTPATTGMATLSWSKPAENTDGSSLTNLMGYVIRYGTSTAALNTVVAINSTSMTSATIENLSPGPWYFEVAAVNTAGVESPFSAAASKTVQ